MDQTAEGIDISVDTARTGSLHGTVALKGPTGETAIAVDVDVVSSSSQFERQAVKHALQPSRQPVRNGQAKPSVPPRLELSATIVDFGQLFPHGHSPERRVQLHNAGGGSLNPRAGTAADWIKLSQDGDELVVTVDTSTVGEYEAAITINSDGGSATIRVQARVVASETTSEEHTGTNHPLSPATSGRQQRRISAKAWIFGGTFAGIALIGALIAALASSHTPQPAGSANSARPPTFLFIDDFSGTTNGWTIIPGHGSFGKYSNGTYQVYLNPVKLDSRDYLGSGLATPVSVSVLNPAPQNITIGVTARQITRDVNVNYGIACRSNRVAYTYYDFEIASDGDATIDKSTFNNYTTLTHSYTAPVNPDGTNQLQATCTTVNGQNAVHLVFWVNGNKILEVIDRKNPLTNGATGIIADSIERNPAAVQFDKFVVTRN